MGHIRTIRQPESSPCVMARRNWAVAKTHNSTIRARVCAANKHSSGFRKGNAAPSLHDLVDTLHEHEFILIANMPIVRLFASYKVVPQFA